MASGFKGLGASHNGGEGIDVTRQRAFTKLGAKKPNPKMRIRLAKRAPPAKKRER